MCIGQEPAHTSEKSSRSMQRNPPQMSGEKSGRANSEARTAASGSKEAPATRVGIERDADTGTAGTDGHSVSMGFQPSGKCLELELAMIGSCRWRTVCRLVLLMRPAQQIVAVDAPSTTDCGLIPAHMKMQGPGSLSMTRSQPRPAQMRPTRVQQTSTAPRWGRTNLLQPSQTGSEGTKTPSN